MFRSLLTPLTARFTGATSPSRAAVALPGDAPIEEEGPEDFELDEHVDNMRNALEEVRMLGLDNIRRKLEVRVRMKSNVDGSLTRLGQ